MLLQGAVGLAIWVPSVANQPKESETADTRSPGKGYSSLPVIEGGGGNTGRRADGSDIELSAVEKAVDCSIVDEDAILDDLKVLFVPPLLLMQVWYFL